MSKNLICNLFFSVVMLSFTMGCESKSPIPPAAANDLLSKILARGTIVIATDADYPPQSEVVPGAQRDKNTKCTTKELTSGELTGFDVSTAAEVALRLGVEPCFVTPQWNQVITGNWDSRWDIHIGSMTITQERMKSLNFAQPYYATPAAMFVHKDNSKFTSPADLSGKRVGACTGCTYDDYLRGVLDIPGSLTKSAIKDPRIIGYDIDITALKKLSSGDGANIDAVLVAQPTAMRAIRDGMLIKQLGEPVFFEHLAPSFDKRSNLNTLTLAVRVTEIIRSMHADATLLKLSQRYYGADYTTMASRFDITSLGQLQGGSPNNRK